MRLFRVYSGTQLGFEVNWSGGHSARMPSSQRISSQCSVMIFGGSVSQAVAIGVNHLEELMYSLDGIVLVSNPRRLHLTF